MDKALLTFLINRRKTFLIVKNAHFNFRKILTEEKDK